MRQITCRLYREDEEKLESIRRALEHLGLTFSTSETIRVALGLAEKRVGGVVDRIIQKDETLQPR